MITKQEVREFLERRGAIVYNDNHRYDGNCTYFLFEKNELVYIGASTNITLRMNNHKWRGYDEMFFIPASKYSGDSFRAVEWLMIRTFRTKWNTQPINDNGKYANRNIAEEIKKCITPKLLQIPIDSKTEQMLLFSEMKESRQ
jgi:hypothetical protein